RRAPAAYRAGGARLRLCRIALCRPDRYGARSRRIAAAQLGLDGRGPRRRVRRGVSSRQPAISMKNRLRVLRAERDWSQADLAQRLSVSRQTVNAIETERYDPSLPLAFAIATLFGKLIEEVFEPERSSEK